MAFRFKKKESFKAGFHRIAAEQFSRARSEWDRADRVVAIHETRKCLKRLRALLRLFRPSLTPHDYAKTNSELRDIAKQLSATRDRQVMLEMIGWLKADASPEQKKALNALREAVAGSRAAEPTKKNNPFSEKKFSASLHHASKRFETLELNGKGFDLAARGFEKTYKKGASTMAQLLDEETEERSHEWRKCVQAHWRQLSLLSVAWPEFFEARIAVATRLSNQLGWDHDLAVLQNFCSSTKAPGLSQQARAKIADMIEERQKELRRTSFADGKLLYADPPRSLLKSVARYWEIASG
jgi:CHAD domain-containing protein